MASSDMPMIFSLFLTVIFFFALFFFGWQLAQFFLKENKKEHLLGLGGIFGLGLYIFFVNALGYFIPIKIVFYLVWFLFLVLGLILFYFNKSKVSEWGIDKKWKKILLGTTMFLVVSSALVYFRYPPVVHGPGGLPITATMASGNFPPVEIWNPNHPLRYHYTLELVSAGLYKMTGLPIHLANDFQVAILAGLLFLLGFSLVKRFFYNDNFGAFISSLLMIYAGGLVFLNGLKGIPVLYNLYLGHQEISAPFKFVTDSINFSFSGPVLNNVIRFTWGSLLFPLTIVVIYLYFHIIANRQKSKMVILFCSLLFAVLALAAEVFFSVLWLVVLIYPFIFGLMKKDWVQAKNFWSVSFWILLIATPLAFIQGGFLRSVLDAVGSRLADFTGFGRGLFNVNKVVQFSEYYESEGLPIFRPEFYAELGLLLVLLIPAFIFLLKKNFPLGFFLAIFTLVSFSIAAFVPLGFFIYIADVFHYFVRMGEMWRFFFTLNLIGGLAAGLFLAHLYLTSKKIRLKRAALFVAAVLMLQGLLFQLVYLSIGYPPAWNASAPYYARLGSFEQRAYNWIRENTTINDLFLITEKNCNYTSSFTPNYRFVINTGRMAPIYAYHCLFPENDLFKKIKENCDPSAVKDLRYSYLYVNKDWIYGLEEKCLANNNLELKFKAGEGDESVRIYKVK